MQGSRSHCMCDATSIVAIAEWPRYLPGSIGTAIGLVAGSGYGTETAVRIVVGAKANRRRDNLDHGDVVKLAAELDRHRTSIAAVHEPRGGGQPARPAPTISGLERAPLSVAHVGRAAFTVGFPAPTSRLFNLLKKVLGAGDHPIRVVGKIEAIPRRT